MTQKSELNILKYRDSNGKIHEINYSNEKNVIKLFNLLAFCQSDSSKFLIKNVQVSTGRY